MKATPTSQGRPALTLHVAAALSADEVLKHLASRAGGLHTTEVEERTRDFGPNVLAVHRVRASVVLWRQVKNPILILLLGAALVSGLTGGGTNAIIIAVIVMLSVGLGFFNEFRAAVAMSSLRSKISQNAAVRRDAGTTQIPVTELVPGDVVALELGALVPADVRLLSVDEFECDEAVLTGESMPVEKSAAAVADSDVPSQANCAYMGTIVHQGSALAVVVVPSVAAVVGAILPYTGLAHLFGFSALPTRFFLLLFATVVVYLVLVEAAKLWFFRRQSPHLAITATTHDERLNHRIGKRATRFVRHEGPTLR